MKLEGRGTNKAPEVPPGLSSRLDVPSRPRSPLPAPASLPLASSTTGSLKKDKTHGQQRAPSDSASGRIRAAGAFPEQEHHWENFLQAKASSGRCYTTLDAAHSGMDDGAIVVGVDTSAANFPGGCHHAVHVGCSWKQLDSELAGAPQILQNVCGSLAALRLT